MNSERPAPNPVRSDILADSPSNTAIDHGFFSRHGGVSEGIYRGLNVGLGSNDERENVLKNRALVAGWFNLDVDRLVTVHQVHSPDVHIVTAQNKMDKPKADALVTQTPGLIIGVLTADCGPVLFADPDAGVIGAAHAGWRGAFEGVLENTLTAMQSLGATTSRIIAVLGPSISQQNYEVGPEFVERFIKHTPAYSDYFKASGKPDHALFDLRQFTLDKLRALGLKADMLPDCTYADPQKWFSYRRATHLNEADYGRHISAIAVKEDSHGPTL